MNGGRKLLISLLSIVLLGSLLGTAVATSAKYSASDPKKIEKWLNESKIYDHFVSNANEQAKKSVGISIDDHVASISDAAVQDAAKSAFSPTLVQENINKFVDSNYAWLEGKTDKPSFVIDLTAAKQTFAGQVAAYVTQHLATLPVCTDATSAQSAVADPLNATCRPPSVSPEAAGAQVKQQIATSDEFLSNPILTAQNINPDPASQSDPYYKKFEHLPKAYRLGLKLPYVFAGLALLSALVIVVLYIPHRKGWRWVGIVFGVAGLLLVLIKFTSDMAFRLLEDRVFNTSNNGDLQKSLTAFAHQVENASVKIDLLFGIAFLLIASLILVSLYFIKGQNSPKLPLVLSDLEPIEEKPRAETKLGKKRPSNSEKPLPPRRTKPPRLIQ